MCTTVLTDYYYDYYYHYYYTNRRSYVLMNFVKLASSAYFKNLSKGNIYDEFYCKPEKIDNIK